jgi:UDP-N-acetylmuramyl pentapeptide phosphotransferase/UDP-N-acetylglucosamine-1-phosphate transferase
LLCAIYMPGRDSWKFLVFAVFMLLACLLRRDAMLMLQPLGLSAIVGLLLTDKRKNVRDKIRFLLLTLGIVIGCFALGELGTAVGYHNAEWKEYLRYNNARTEI